ncbi:MAG: DUF4340 domain-containing protein [Treponema sp.]|nr:DUF4340 domain-containing protein [Treponema sp.]
MTYKKKLIFLLSLISVLVLLLIGNIIYFSDVFTRGTSFVWLESRAIEGAGRVVFDTGIEEFELVRLNNAWFVLHNENLFPARQVRVQDFFRTVTNRALWPVRSTNAATHEQFGLTENASRITIFGDSTAVSPPLLLDLLIGNDSSFRRETYFRRFGHNEVRSGDSSIRIYLGLANTWFNLRLFPETEEGQIDVNAVQRLTVRTPLETQMFTRSQWGWEIQGIEVENPSAFTIESYIRIILTTEGDNFLQYELDANITFDDLVNYSIEVIFGDGRIVTIRLSDEDETGRRFAHVSGTGHLYGDHIFSIPAWSANRLFRDAESFEFH